MSAAAAGVQDAAGMDSLGNLLVSGPMPIPFVTDFCNSCHFSRKVSEMRYTLHLTISIEDIRILKLKLEEMEC